MKLVCNFVIITALVLACNIVQFVKFFAYLVKNCSILAIYECLYLLKSQRFRFSWEKSIKFVDALDMLLHVAIDCETVWDFFLNKAWKKEQHSNRDSKTNNSQETQTAEKTNEDKQNSSRSEIVRDSSSQTPFVYNHPITGQRQKLHPSELPPHLHTACDILPCPHQPTSEANQQTQDDSERTLTFSSCPRQDDILETSKERLQLSAPAHGSIDAPALNSIRRQQAKNSSRYDRCSTQKRSSFSPKDEVCSSEAREQATTKERGTGIDINERFETEVKTRNQSKVISDQSKQTSKKYHKTAKKRTATDNTSKEENIPIVGNVINEVCWQINIT